MNSPTPPQSRTVVANSTALAENPPTAFLQDVGPDEAAKLLAEPGKVVVLDIRTPDEFKEGHIAGATNVDFRNASFAQDLGKLDKNQPYLMHCRSGGRSSKALEMMRDMGFTAVYHLKGGTLAWENAGQPLEK